MSASEPRDQAGRPTPGNGNQAWARRVPNALPAGLQVGSERLELHGSKRDSLQRGSSAARKKTSLALGKQRDCATARAIDTHQGGDGSRVRSHFRETV